MEPLPDHLAGPPPAIRSTPDRRSANPSPDDLVRTLHGDLLRSLLGDLLRSLPGNLLRSPSGCPVLSLENLYYVFRPLLINLLCPLPSELL